MQCKTERCLIRELVPDDWKSMQKIAVDFRKSKYAVYDMPLPVEDAEIIARTKQFAQTQMFYAVLLHDVMIGYICFHEDHGMYDLGYCFHSDYQGKGYAFESCCAMMNYIFHERSINIFTAGTALENKPSCKLLEKLGFTLQNENYDWDTLALMMQPRLLLAALKSINKGAAANANICLSVNAVQGKQLFSLQTFFLSYVTL